MKKNKSTFLERNDVTIRIFLSFVTIMVAMVVLIAGVFLLLYRRNTINSYAEILVNQGRIISKKVTAFSSKGKSDKFAEYVYYVENLQNADDTDVWIVTNKDAKHPLTDNFTNADIDKNIDDDMKAVLKKAFKGETAIDAGYDKVYRAYNLKVAIPVYENKKKESVSGAVMMVTVIGLNRLQIDKGIYIIIVSIIIAFMVSLVLAMILTSFLTKPLIKLDKHIMQMIDGDYSTQNISAKSPQLKKVNDALTDLCAKLDKIDRERKSLDKAKNEFFANVSHELRTPITVMRGYAESLSDGVITDEKSVNEYYERILNECKTMEHLVNDLFLLSKMENPDFQMESEPVSVYEILDEVIQNANQIAAKKDIKINEDLLEEENIFIKGDYVRLRQMLLIVVDNAVKFSNEGSDIDIGLYRKGTKIKVYIKDYGVGISEEDKQHIFEKFFKSNLKQNEKGTGLGLMIAKNIADRHNCKIELRTEEGKGSEFIFTFEELDVSEYA
ncbi:MAG: HAMP domain-containing histidine kinase [Lachnospiraceae bacterium]|nr:HAMP domain-containing histidine kinase [Lachnospiraceae bacterium]